MQELRACKKLLPGMQADTLGNLGRDSRGTGVVREAFDKGAEVIAAPAVLAVPAVLAAAPSSFLQPPSSSCSKPLEGVDCINGIAPEGPA